MKNWRLKTEYEDTVVYERQVDNLYQSVELEKSLVVEVIKDIKLGKIVIHSLDLQGIIKVL